MAEEEEKTEQPTEQRLRQAREEGNIPRSIDTQAFILLVVSFLSILFLFDFEANRLGQLYLYYSSFIGNTITLELVFDIAIKTAMEFLILFLVFSLPLIIAAIFASFIQHGFVFTPGAIAPKFNKLNPLPGLKKLFGFEKFVDAMQITIKSMLALGVMSWFFFSNLELYYDTPAYGASSQYQWFKSNIIELFAILILLFLAFALFDYFWKRRKYTESLKMTKDEVKREHKQQEGSQEVKHKIRQIRQQLLRSSMIKSVPKADVVITNPTHFAVALLYEKSKHQVPIVVAKGMDNMAMIIKKIAKENDIPIIENKKLAQELYKNVDVNEGIPNELFSAVINIYRIVMEQDAKKRDKWL